MALNLDTILQTIPAAIIGLTVHEYSHAAMSNRLGDDTAKLQGRLTLNPLKHIDLIGLILIVLAGFGWAKPVRFNPDNLKHKHRDEILIAIAGPLSNLALGFLFILLGRLLYFFDFFNSTDTGIKIVNMMLSWTVVNWGLCIFNLLPIPPLDGSHVYTTFLKEINPAMNQRLYQFGTWGLLAIIMIENRLEIDILPIGKILTPMIHGVLRLLQFN